MSTPADPATILRSRSYLGLLILAALLGAPVSAAAYGFLALVDYLQPELFVHLPRGFGFSAAPVWWPLPVLAVGGLLTGLAVRYLPGHGGAAPSIGFHLHTAPLPVEVPGVVLAALATLVFGAVLGPELPLIALGGGLAGLAVRALRRGAPEQALAIATAAGSFAAIATLLGSPILGAFLLMEASGVGGATLGLVLVPGLLSAGIGSLIFIGLDHLTGLGTFSLAIPGLPSFTQPTGAEFGWALVLGVAAALAGQPVAWLSRMVKSEARRRTVTATVIAGLVVAGLAIVYAEATGKPGSEVLFSGQSAIGPLIKSGSSYPVWVLLLLLACKGIAYGVSLGTFRGGPVFPAMFLGAVGGIALSHVPGLPAVAGAAMGMGAMSVVMLSLPMSSVLLATLLLLSDGLAVMPLVIVAVVVAYVVNAVLAPRPAADAVPEAASAGSS